MIIDTIAVHLKYFKYYINYVQYIHISYASVVL